MHVADMRLHRRRRCVGVACGKGANGGRDGDLYLDIVLHPHPLYRVSGNDLYLDLPITPWEAILGTTVTTPTPA